MNFRGLLVALGDRFYYKSIEKELKGMQSVLDVGCGDNSPLAKIKKTFYSLGIDVFAPSIKKSKKNKIHDDYKIGDLLKLSKMFGPKTFDAVVSLDVVEHFEKKDALKLIKDIEKIAKKKVIIFTPYGFTQQHEYDKNPFQIHKSGWLPQEFERRGYKIYGMRGFRFIRGEFATIKYRPWFFWGAFSVLSQVFVYKKPSWAYQFIAVKEI